MADDDISQFTGITGADAAKATQYLTIADHNLEQAIQLYFESGGVDLGTALPSEQPTNTPATAANPISIDDDDNNSNPAHTGAASHSVEDDEAMARRLQDEMYGSMGGAPGAVGDDIDPETGVRAPMARTTETLAGPNASWQDDPEGMRAAIAEQLAARQQRRQNPGMPSPFEPSLYWEWAPDVQFDEMLMSPPPPGRPGIFNQQPVQSSAAIWDSEPPSSSSRRHNLSRATGGASDASSKSNMLAEMYRPPFELISPRRTWEGVRAEGKEDEKWILINIQDPNIFDCQILNRDIWKDESIQATVKEHFVFKQYTKNDPQAGEYVRYYFPSVDSEDAYPHIAIVDPRTGERMKVWSGSPSPKAGEFLMQLHEFLDRYSLKADVRNPVAVRKAEKARQKDPGMMTEEEQMAMAMQESLGGGGGRKGSGPREDDPDTLTRQNGDGHVVADADAGAPPATAVPVEAQQQDTPFSKISSTHPHEEPAKDAPDQTRIQFRHPGGRVIRRFLLNEKVERIYEWLKAEPLPEMVEATKEGEEMDKKEKKEFQLIAMGRDLIDAVGKGETVGEAGLRNGTVMVEFGS